MAKLNKAIEGLLAKQLEDEHQEIPIVSEETEMIRAMSALLTILLRKLDDEDDDISHKPRKEFPRFVIPSPS